MLAARARARRASGRFKGPPGLSVAARDAAAKANDAIDAAKDDSKDASKDRAGDDAGAAPDGKDGDPPKP